MSNLIRQYNKITTEMPMETNKVGIVILVGIADKLTESTAVPGKKVKKWCLTSGMN